MITFRSKKRKQSKWPMVSGVVCGLLGMLFLAFTGISVTKGKFARSVEPKSKLSDPIQVVIPTPLPSPTPTPTPKPLTFAEMNVKYGPCVSLPVLMYHHIQSEEQAKAKGQTGLTVYTPIFREQMQYLKDQGYVTISPRDLITYLETGSRPIKAVLITVDDGYEDNFTDMYPVLKEMSFKATVFLATGLMENPDYLKWYQIAEMANNGIYFGNHTWSHKNMKTSGEMISKEVGTAEIQLKDHGLNSDKVFAYPWGAMSGNADKYLADEGYTLAFDTVSGRIQCAKQKYALPRIRVGNGKLSGYGL